MAHVTSLRLPDDLYEQAASLARRRHTSFNGFIEATVRREVQAELDRELYDAGTILGLDPESDVDFAFAAQSDVVLRD